MLVYQVKSWRYLLPIRDALLRRGHCVTLFSPRRESDEFLAAKQLQFVSLPPVVRDCKFVAELDELVDCLPLQLEGSTAMSLGQPQGPLRHWLRDVLQEWTAEYARVAGTLPSLFKQFGINCAVGTDSGSIAGRSYFRTAELMSIESVFVQHGAFTQESGVAEYFTNSTKLLWGDSSKQSLVRSGLSDNASLKVVGSPFVEEEMQQRISSIGLDQNQDPFVLVTFGVPGNLISEAAFQSAATEVIAAARDLPDLRFLVKPHPSDRTSTWNRLIEAASLPNLTLNQVAETYSLMAQCRALVTMFSTTGSEAAFLGKPVISVNLCGIKLRLDYMEAGAAYIALKPGDLRSILSEILNELPGNDRLAQARRDFGAMFLHRNAVSARERIADRIEELYVNPMRTTEPLAEIRSRSE